METTDTQTYIDIHTCTYVRICPISTYIHTYIANVINAPLQNVARKATLDITTIKALPSKITNVNNITCQILLFATSSKGTYAVLYKISCLK